MNHLAVPLAASLACTLFALAGCQPAAVTPDSAPPAASVAADDPAPAADGFAPAELSLPFRARGQEPGWNLAADTETVTLVTGYGAWSVSLPLMNIEQLGRVTRLHAHDDSHRLMVETERAVCHDTMSDIPFPYRVTVELDGERLAGCGGESLELLAGISWVVEDLDGGGIIDRSLITLDFLPGLGERRVAGTASCNRYFASYELTGESLTIGRPGSTMMACTPALMDQEQKFLRILQGVRSFDINADGALVLRGPEGAIRARRKLHPIM